MSASSCCSSCPSAPEAQARAAGASSMTRMAIQCSEGLQAAYAPSSGPSPKQAAPGAVATLFSALGAGGWRIPGFPDRRLVRPATSCRSPASATGSSGGQQRSGSSQGSVAGGSLHDAAQYLGIASAGTAWPGYGIYAGAGHVHSGARKQHGPLAFENALEALARELDHLATPLVNYQSRRQALQAWCIDKDTWMSLTARLPPVPAPSSPTSETGNASSPPSTSGSRSHQASTSSPRALSRAIMPPILRKPWTPSTSAVGNCWTPATPDLTTPA